MDVKKRIEEKKIIAIIRRVYGHDLLKTAEALYDGGINLLEITFDQTDPDCLRKTSDAIAMLASDIPQILLGAGTVLSVEQADAAMKAGAHYIISPNVDEDVIRFTKKKGRVSIPGAMTPSEMLSASKYGADFVKMFPAADLGVSYMKSVMSPISHLKLLAVGGVTTENLRGFFDIGFAGAGIGSYLSDKKLIAEGNFCELQKRAASIMDIALSGKA
jgi:2-dehydro-3-deoxyphosphogluconate aldolase/(4S)-4-hydroxy-2-oxoglutarate aldolase